MSDANSTANGTALAGGAIASALVETLFDKGILSLDESRASLIALCALSGLSCKPPKASPPLNSSVCSNAGSFPHAAKTNNSHRSNSMSNLSNPIFHDEEAARKWLEARVWPNGPVCPHCKAESRATLMKGKTTRAGLYQCNACREPFTVTLARFTSAPRFRCIHGWP